MRLHKGFGLQSQKEKYRHGIICHGGICIWGITSTASYEYRE